MNITMKFPDQHFVTFSHIGPVDSRQKLGFLVPDGTDSAARKRKETAIKWGSKDIPHETHKNTPQHGFKIMTKVSRGGSWNGQQDKWRVMDPRGFILEIPAGNLEQILALTTIKEGTIEGECIWGREGPVNMLVPVDSEIYVEAVKATAIANSATVSVKDVRVGDRITLQNGTVGIYMGHLLFLQRPWGTNQYYMTEKRVHVIKTDGYYTGYAGLKVVSIEPSFEKLLPDDAVREINEKGGGIGTNKSGENPIAVTQLQTFQVHYHKVDVNPDSKPPRSKRAYMTSNYDGRTYRATQDYGANHTMRDIIARKSNYELTLIPDMSEPEVSNRGASYLSVTDADLDKGSYFMIERELVFTEGSFRSML